MNSLSGYVLSLSGRIKNYYFEQGAKNSYFSTYLLSLSGKLNNLYYTNVFNGITNNSSLYQVGASIFYNSVCVSGALFFGNSTNPDNNNTDSMYIKRNYIAGNVSELAVYIGDDGTQAISYFPPQNESTPTDFLAYEQVIQVILTTVLAVLEITIAELVYIVLIILMVH